MFNHKYFPSISGGLREDIGPTSREVVPITEASARMPLQRSVICLQGILLPNQPAAENWACKLQGEMPISQAYLRHIIHYCPSVRWPEADYCLYQLSYIQIAETLAQRRRREREAAAIGHIAFATQPPN